MAYSCEECGRPASDGPVGMIVAGVLICVALGGGFLYGKKKMADEVCSSRGFVSSIGIDDIRYCEKNNGVNIEREPLFKVN